MVTERATTTDAAEIRQRLESWAAAVRAKDLDALMSHYLDDIVVFDLAPPLQYKGLAAYRKNWEDWFPSFEGAVGYQIHELKIHTTGDVAFCHSLNRLGGSRTSGENSDTWFRATVGLRKIRGMWMIAHEHFSVPINMETFNGVLDLKP